jgi:kumamolisin
MGDAFGVELQRYDSPQGSYRGRTGPVHVPSALADIVTGVLGLDDRPQARPLLRKREGEFRPANAPDGSFTPPEVAQLYAFPGVNGQGQTIGIIELGGGFTQDDLDTYFGGLGIPTPQVTAVSVGLGQNQPGGAADGEVLLDIDVAGGVAPGANIVVYFAQNTAAGFLNAVTTAIHDSTNNPSVISISWGNPEAFWTTLAMQNMDQAFQAAPLLGVTICCASGDDGSNDGGPPGNNVDFPASSPFALGCGGTRLFGASTTISSEDVWNDQSGATGGGVSNVFLQPGWQANANVPAGGIENRGRGVPDVSGDADPATGYQVRVDGVDRVFGGTSAVAPLWAGLIALLNQSLGQPVGFLNPVIYGLPANVGAFRDITSGNNGAFQAGPGWDACTGLGSPNGSILLSCLQSLHNPDDGKRPTGKK